MATVEERSKAYVKSCVGYPEEIINMMKKAYIQGAKDQKKLDIDKACEWILDNFSCEYSQSTLYYYGNSAPLHQPKYIAKDFREDMEKE